MVGMLCTLLVCTCCCVLLCISALASSAGMALRMALLVLRAARTFLASSSASCSLDLHVKPQSPRLLSSLQQDHHSRTLTDAFAKLVTVYMQECWPFYP